MLWSILRSRRTIIVQSSLSSRYVTNWTLPPWTMFSNVADRSNWTSHTMGGLVTSSCVIDKMLFVVIHVLEKMGSGQSLMRIWKTEKGPPYGLLPLMFWVFISPKPLLAIILRFDSEYSDTNVRSLTTSPVLPIIWMNIFYELITFT